jgi:hypothetical protein
LVRARARREASREIVAWERPVLAALLAERGAPPGARFQAVRLVATGPLRRWARRGAYVLATGTLVVLVPAVLALELVIRSL